LDSLLFIIIVLALLIGAYLRSAKFKGSIGETKVSKTLGFLLPSNKYTIFNDVTLPSSRSTTQIDHIVVSRFGVFVIETKNYKGWIFGNARSKQWTQVLYKKKYPLFNPLWQNKIHVNAVKRFLNLPDMYVFSVVAFVGNAKIKTKRRLPSNVVYLRQLRRYVRSKKDQVLSEREVQLIIRKFGDHQAGVTTKKRTPKHSVTRIEPECPQCSGKMVKRKATKGRFAGRNFWGCSNYPDCKGIRNI